MLIPGSSARRKRPAASGSASQLSRRRRSVRNISHVRSLGHHPARLIKDLSSIHHESTVSLATQPRHPRSPHKEYDDHPYVRTAATKLTNWPTACRGSKSCQAGRQLRFSASSPTPLTKLGALLWLNKTPARRRHQSWPREYWISRVPRSEIAQLILCGYEAIGWGWRYAFHALR